MVKRSKGIQLHMYQLGLLLEKKSNSCCIHQDREAIVIGQPLEISRCNRKLQEIEKASIPLSLSINALQK